MAVARVTENEALTGDVTAMPVEGAIMPETYVFRARPDAPENA